MASETDPSGFVSSPPSTIVKIINTAREDMNGQLGIVIQFQQDRGRYLVHLTKTQNVVAMKPEKLVKAGYMEQAQAYYQQATRDPQIQNILTQVTAKLPAGVTLQHAGIAMGVILLALVYLLGFSRTMMLVSFVILIMIIVGPDLLAGADSNTIIRNAPMRFQTIMREQVPGGSYLAGKPQYERYVHMLLAAMLIVFFVKSMMPVSSNAATATTNGMPVQPSRNLMSTQKMAEEYYKLGFDDAKADNIYGTSLPDLSTTTEATSEAYDAVMDDLPDYPMPPPTRAGDGGIMGKLFSMTSAMSLMYLGRTAMDLGREAGGGWSFALFKANLATLEPWKLGLLGLSLYRLVSAVIF